MLRAVEDTAAWTTAKIGAIRRLVVDTAEYMRQKVPKIYSRELVDFGVGVLREQAFGKEKLFLHPKLVTLLTRDSNEFESYRLPGQ